MIGKRKTILFIYVIIRLFIMALKAKWYCPSVPLSEAYRYQSLRFTYKKDWLAALSVLGINL